MKRRVFLEKSLILCSTLWGSQNLLQAHTIWAAAAPRIITVRWAFHREAQGQKYVRLVIETSAKCEVTVTHDNQNVKIAINNCRSDGAKRALSLDGQITSKAEITTDKGGNTQISVSLRPQTTVPHIHCYYLPGTQAKGSSRIVVDIGNKLREKLKSVPIEETQLKFGPLETRTDTNLIVVHHVGSTDKDVSAAEIHQWHLANGWSGIGYHYVVRKNGTIERGRPMDSVGAHVYGFNEKSIGIVVVGDFEQAIPKDAQLDATARLMAELCTLYKIRPATQTIVGHRDLLITACPGCNLYSKISQIRGKVQSYQRV